MADMTTREEVPLSEFIEEMAKDWLSPKWHKTFREDCERLVKVALASRQEVSVTVEELARSICRTDHINGAPSCVMDDHPERDPCGDENCRRFEQARALLAKYSITNRTE